MSQREKLHEAVPFRGAEVPSDRSVVKFEGAGQVQFSNNGAADLRDQALKMWSQGDRAATLRLLRGALRDHPMDSLLWMSLGQRLQEIGDTDSSYFAYTNAVETDPGNFVALEQFIAIAESRNDSAIIDEVLSKLPEALLGRPHRFLESLDYSIPFGITEAMSVVEQNDDGLAKTVVERSGRLERATEQHTTKHASAAVQIRVAITRDDVWEVLNILPNLSRDEIPADSLRRLIRRVRSWSKSDSESI